MKTPLIVTHPSTLLHDGLRQIFAKSQFGPVLITPKLSEELESQMRSFESCIWLIGAGRYDSTVDHLLRRVTTAAPGAKAVILAADHAPGDIMTALKGGICGFLCQDISAEQLLKSLELIACGQAVVHRDWRLGGTASAPVPDNGETKQQGVSQAEGVESDGPQIIAADNSEGTSESELTRSLSRRELLILRMLTEGASNKVIALKLVITESTVKVHMKAILRKLRLLNRTQAAMWARNHVHEDVWNALSSSTQYAGSRRRDSVGASPSFVC